MPTEASLFLPAFRELRGGKYCHSQQYFLFYELFVFAHRAKNEQQAHEQDREILRRLRRLKPHRAYQTLLKQCLMIRKVLIKRARRLAGNALDHIGYGRSVAGTIKAIQCG